MESFFFQHTTPDEGEAAELKLSEGEDAVMLPTEGEAAVLSLGALLPCNE